MTQLIDKFTRTQNDSRLDLGMEERVSSYLSVSCMYRASLVDSIDVIDFVISLHNCLLKFLLPFHQFISYEKQHLLWMMRVCSQGTRDYSLNVYRVIIESCTFPKRICEIAVKFY